MAPESDILRLLRKVRQRMIWLAVSRAGAWGISIAGVLSVSAILLANRAGVDPRPMLHTALVIGLAVVAVKISLAWQNLLTTAVKCDVELGLRDLLSTALVICQRGDGQRRFRTTEIGCLSSVSDTGAWERAIVARAALTAAGVEARDIPAGNSGLRAWCVGGLLMGAVWIMPVPGAVGPDNSISAGGGYRPQAKTEVVAGRLPRVARSAGTPESRPPILYPDADQDSADAVGGKAKMVEHPTSPAGGGGFARTQTPVTAAPSAEYFPRPTDDAARRIGNVPSNGGGGKAANADGGEGAGTVLRDKPVSTDTAVSSGGSAGGMPLSSEQAARQVPAAYREIVRDYFAR